MRLVLAIPAAAPRRELDDGRTLVVLAGPEDRPAATLTLIHPSILPMSLIEFASDLPRSELPPGAISELQSARVDRNQIGWEMQVVHTSVYRQGEKDVLEHRLAAIYRFVSYQPFVAAAVARIFEPHRLDELRPQIVALFQTGRPDWSGLEPASLAQFYD
jgi:hypothetical protein